MVEDNQDQALVIALLKRFKLRVPRMIEIKEDLEKGEKIIDEELKFIEEMVHDAQKNKGFTDQHPEYHDLAAKVISLYDEITELALENEKNQD